MTSATHTNIRPSSRVARSEAIVFTELDDTVLMMDVEEGRYYELNPVGARIWALIESRTRIAEVCEALVAEYEVALDVCGDEAREFLNELRRREVVRILPGNGANEIANHDTRDPEAPSTSGRNVTAGLAEAETKLAWTTPTIRVMGVRHVAGGSYTRTNPEAAVTYPYVARHS